jgi:hypothetical protein
MANPQCSKKGCFGGWTYRNCHRKGVIQRDNEWYCKQHDPVAIKAKRDEEEQRWQAKRKRNEATYARREALEKLADGIETKDLHKYQLTKSK